MFLDLSDILMYRLGNEVHISQIPCQTQFSLNLKCNCLPYAKTDYWDKRGTPWNQVANLCIEYIVFNFLPYKYRGKIVILLRDHAI